jgi:hypothetical protein
MKRDFTEINGKQVKLTDMEYLYSYMDEEGTWMAVYEYEGKQVKGKIIQDGYNQ